MLANIPFTTCWYLIIAVCGLILSVARTLPTTTWNREKHALILALLSSFFNVQSNAKYEDPIVYHMPLLSNGYSCLCYICHLGLLPSDENAILGPVKSVLTIFRIHHWDQPEREKYSEIFLHGMFRLYLRLLALHSQKTCNHSVRKREVDPWHPPPQCWGQWWQTGQCLLHPVWEGGRGRGRDMCFSWGWSKHDRT